MGQGKNVVDFEQIKESSEDLDDYNDEILSIPVKIKLQSLAVYTVSQAMILLQLLVVFATLDLFLVICILMGHLFGFLLFGFKRRCSYLMPI